MYFKPEVKFMHFDVDDPYTGTQKYLVWFVVDSGP